MRKKGQYCHNCRYWRYETVDRGAVCTNADSEYICEWTDENDFCDEWEDEQSESG